MSQPKALLADIGATNARFALLADGGVSAYQVLQCAEHETLNAAIAAYLKAQGLESAPRAAAIAIAGPVTGDDFAMTNHPWSFSIAEKRRFWRFEQLAVVNDFAAVALSLPHLGGDDLIKVGPGAAEAGRAMAVLGPGTGLGVAGLVPLPGGGHLPLPGEGGHVTLAAMDRRELAIIEALHDRYNHVSAERVLSGKGLVNLHRAIAGLDGVAGGGELSPEEISARGLSGECRVCVEALDRFCAFLGSVAGNLALSLGARGGVYVAGGITPRIRDFFLESRFRARFEEKGRMKAFLAPIPTSLIIHPQPAFVGLAAIAGAKGYIAAA